MTPGSRLKVYEGPAHGLFISVKDGPNANHLAFRRMIESQPLMPFDEAVAQWSIARPLAKGLSTNRSRRRIFVY
jgi:hypothetical protein